jgi:RNA polymerase sigma factor (sigma-70 family)
MPATLAPSRSPLEQLRRRRVPADQSVDARFSADQQEQLHGLLEAPISFIDDPLFHEADAYQRLFDNAPEIPQPNTSWYHPVMDDLSARRAHKKIVNVVLSAEQERALFLQFNYCRFRAASIQREVDERQLSAGQARELLNWHQRSQALRDRIAQFNLALVLAMAKRMRSSDLDFADLISEGNMALLRAVDKFNVSRGFKFSTYACRAILKAFSRIGVKQTQYRNMFPTDFDPAMERSDHAERKFEDRAGDCASEVRRIVVQNTASLTEVEQQVIAHRFALDRQTQTPPLTLEQVGKLVGLTKERVRQIQNKALGKIRRSLEAQFIDGTTRRSKGTGLPGR